MCQISAGDIFIDERDNYTYYRKRGAQVLRSVLRDGGIGLVGSDVMWEQGFDGGATSLGTIRNENGEPLRFALLTRPGEKSRFENKAKDGELIRVATSYPNIASQSFMTGDIEYLVEEGGIELELATRPELDCAYELVQSADTVRAYDLEIAYDALMFIDLMLVRPRSDENNA
jgi:ATP phosphoribosyltransferase